MTEYMKINRVKDITIVFAIIGALFSLALNYDYQRGSLRARGIVITLAFWY